jgi:hypothetical protein
MNYSGNPATICDYITVFFEDGNITDKGATEVGEWYIPSSAYYYQNRGTMALISIADATYHADDNQNILIGYDNAFNGTIAQVGSADPLPNNLAILGNLYQTSNAAEVADGLYAYNKTEPIKILTSARPSIIRLHFFKDNKAIRNMDDRGCITLKFEYLSPEAEKEINQAVSYVPAFPEPKSF